VPGGDGGVEPGLDLGEVAPLGEGPALRAAQSDQVSLGEYHVRIGSRVSIALAVADENDGSAGGLVGQDPLPFAGSADQAIGVAVGEGHFGVGAIERRLSGDDRDRRNAECA
jgi:hypothetical protein